MTLAIVLAVAEVLLILLGLHVEFSNLLVWLPGLAGPGIGAVAFRRAAAGATGDLHLFWRRLGFAMAVVQVAAVSQVVDVLTLPFDGMPPIGPRTLLLYIAGTSMAIVALMRLPGGGRTWRQVATAVLDVAVVGVTAGIACWQYLGWAVSRFGGHGSAWWLNLAVSVIGVAGVMVIVKIMTMGRSPVSKAALWWLSPIGTAGPLSAALMTVLAPWPHLSGSAAVLPFVGLFGVLAARAQLRSVAPDRMTLPPLYRRGSAVPLVATGLTSLLIAAVYLDTGTLASVHVAGMTLLLLLVVARQALALAENTTLLETVAHQAMHDELTGLFSRRYFAEAAAHGGSVVLVDLRDFRSMNDGLGAATGDALLIAFADRLRALAGERDVVARLDGDEFGLLVADPEPVLERLLAATAEPLHANGYELLVEVSAGLAAGFPQAEIALREAAGQPGQHLVRWDESLKSRVTQRAAIAADMRRALAEGEFHMLYQPIVELPSRRMTGVESLIRWREASPADFIPVAEDTGLIIELGAWIIDAVCAQAAAWPSLRSVAVNVSARQLLDPALPEVIASALARHGIPAHRLTVEITETAVFGGGRALATVDALHALGVSIALDDFGTGHSSLSLLRTCPVDVIKVDKSFVDGLNGTPQQEAIAVAVIGITETLGLRTVAEGVETEEQTQRLYELGYRLVQGFHFARPLPPESISGMLGHTLSEAS
ncbi:MAG TPA: GGDEF domain-containing phosphodiesterase [Actinoplanes sp.]|nr:GGDEF domain-containing phosphodiesterase [Actinoplanes sp.]